MALVSDMVEAVAFSLKLSVQQVVVLHGKCYYFSQHASPIKMFVGETDVPQSPTAETKDREVGSRPSGMGQKPFSMGQRPSNMGQRFMAWAKGPLA